MNVFPGFFGPFQAILEHIRGFFHAFWAYFRPFREYFGPFPSFLGVPISGHLDNILGLLQAIWPISRLFSSFKRRETTNVIYVRKVPFHILAPTREHIADIRVRSLIKGGSFFRVFLWRVYVHVVHLRSFCIVSFCGFYVRFTQAMVFIYQGDMHNTVSGRPPDISIGTALWHDILMQGNI